MTGIRKFACELKLLSALFSGELGTRPGMWTETDAPSDLQVIDIKADETSDKIVWVYCQSATFEPLPDGTEPPIIKPFTYRLLSVESSLTAAYRIESRDHSFAQCPRCKRIFIDDVILYGSLKCPDPQCHAALERGIKIPFDR